MGSSLGFGSSACDYGPCGPRPIQTRFRFGSGRQALTSPHTANSPDHSSIGTPSRYRLRGNTLRLHVGTRFQGLFHSPPGVLFTFPSRYWFTIGHQRYLALGSGLPRFPRGFTCPVVLRYLSEVAAGFVYGAITLFGRPFQGRSPTHAIGNFTMSGPTTPGGRTRLVWASPRSLAANRSEG